MMTTNLTKYGINWCVNYLWDNDTRVSVIKKVVSLYSEYKFTELYYLKIKKKVFKVCIDLFM